MWSEKDALVLIKTYFRKEEVCLFVQRVPRFYAISKGLLFVFSVFATLCLYVFQRLLPSGTVILFLLVDVLLFYDFSLNVLFQNYIVVSQYSIYRYRKLLTVRIDEWEWPDVNKASLRVWRFMPGFATFSLRMRAVPLREASPIKNLLIRKNLYRHLETVDFRELSLRQPRSLRIAVRNHTELRRIMETLKKTEGFLYHIPRGNFGHAE